MTSPRRKKELNMKKTKHVGAAICRLHIEEKAENNIGADALKSVNRKNKGITLIALIITIIVMLILVVVSIQIALNTGLFDAAGKATKDWKEEQDKESNLSVKIGDKEYATVDEYMEEINKPVIEPENIDDWIYIVEEDGTVTLNGYKGTETEVVIPNYINGMPVKKLAFISHGHSSGIFGTFWHRDICTNESDGGSVIGYFYFQRTIKKVIISEGIEKIEFKSFINSKALEKIVLPKSLISLENSFHGCDVLTVTVPWKENEVPESWNLDDLTVIYAE